MGGIARTEDELRAAPVGPRSVALNLQVRGWIIRDEDFPIITALGATAAALATSFATGGVAWPAAATAITEFAGLCWHAWRKGARLSAATRAMCGSRALDLILPASALALRYSRPAEAFPQVVLRLAASAPGAEVEAARALALERPELAGAGPHLGAGVDVRRSWPPDPSSNSLASYDVEMGHLAAGDWGVDGLELLADPLAAMHVGSLPLAHVFQDRVLPGQTSITEAELIARLIIANILLSRAGLPKWELEFARALHAVIA